MGNPLQLTGLNNSSSYDAYFRVDCDSIYSSWVGPVGFATDSTVSIKENASEWDVNVFPNPNDGQFTLSVHFPDQFGLEIYSARGEVVYQKSNLDGGNFEKVFDLSHLPKGVYTLRVRTGDGLYSRKFVIK
jgi:hypothetical protein